MSWHLKRSLWTATLERYPQSLREDRDRSSSLSRRPTRPFLTRPITTGIIQQTCSGSAIANTSIAVGANWDHPRVTRTRSRSSEALIPWKQPRRHSFSGEDTPASNTRPHALPLFTTPRGHHRGAAINTNLFPTEIPDLSFRSIFSPPYYKDQEPSSLACPICKYIIQNSDSGHSTDNHVDSPGCSDDLQPINRGRVSGRLEEQSGVCNNCRQRLREMNDSETLSIEEKLYKESRNEYENLAQEREHEDIAYLLQKSREEADAASEQADIAHMLRKSREDAEAANTQKELEDLARALKSSCALDPVDCEGTVDEEISESQDEVEGGAPYPTRTEVTAPTESKKPALVAVVPPPLPPPPTAPVHLPSPPATPVKAAAPPPQPVDFSQPASRQQDYGHYTIGGRRQPIHESQKQQAAKYLKSPVTPSSPAPVARLSNTIQPSSPSPRQTQSSSPGVSISDVKAGLRRTGGPRQSLPSRTESGDSDELRERLARRRTLEANESWISGASFASSQSTLSPLSRPGSSAGSDVSRASSARDWPLTSETNEKWKKGQGKG
ncbi:hypothetical protein GQ44DRAFT_648156 [Phaeosphaeriaceae sp. PMI808]|nr:hypothetical protein GQ44DRAFT_648156 [Phaeosphaeriaceae sp. PMI808]